MLFNSVHFLFFFPAVVFIYFLLPLKIRWIWLLVASYYFYMAWNALYVLLLTVTIALTWGSGQLIQWSNKQENRKKKNFQRKLWVGLSFASNLLILFFFKYFDFLINGLNQVLVAVGLKALSPSLDVLLPVGISFYTFRALSYTMDVYRGKIAPEKNVFKYALFISFFPQLMAGPIERAKDLLPQFFQRHSFAYDRVKSGLLLMVWGLIQKIVIADRLAILVNQVFDHFGDYGGVQIAIAVLFLAVQLYCDFCAYTDISRGASQVLGFRQTENFRQPYFATSMQDFWKRWHITLGSWFRDYVFLPMSGHLMKKKWSFRSIYVTASLVVWFLTGLWHGANLTFIVWGLLHGLFQITGFLTAPARTKLYTKLRIRTEVFSFRLMQTLFTFSLTCFAWIFFRASSVTDALMLIKRMVVLFNPKALFNDSLYSLGLDRLEFYIAIASIVVLFLIDYMRGKYNVTEWLSSQNMIFRWGAYFVMVLSIVLFGIYGIDYTKTPFVYFQF